MVLPIDFKEIKPLKGSQAAGFEDLCALMALRESPAGAQFTRNAPPDAGVECYCTLDDGSEWGWQAKYFTDSLGPAQWRQIDKSVETALAKRPALARYYVCLPTDLPDARRPGVKSARQQWDEHVSKWKGLAGERAVDFHLWGRFELTERLFAQENLGRIRYWFDKQFFSRDWFEGRLGEAIQSAGPRYTPELHVESPIVKEFDLFSRSREAVDRVKSLAKEIRDASAYVRSSCNEISETSIDGLMRLEKIALDKLAALEYAPSANLPFDIVAQRVDEYGDAVDRFFDLKEQTKEQAGDFTFHQRNSLARLSYALGESHSEIIHASEIANKQVMVLRGKAGVGKTHLLCDIAKKRIEVGAPTILLMGQRFTSEQEPWMQAREHLDLPSAPVEEIIGALEASAEAANQRALIIIDALNEGNGRMVWPAHINAFLAKVENSQWVSVVLSVRSGYEEQIIPDNIRESAARIAHSGFSGQEYDAASRFFAHYELEFASAPIMHPEFQNPLFLKMLCESLHAKGEKRVPLGSIGVTEIFDAYLDSVNERIAAPDKADYNQNDRNVHEALKAFAARMMGMGTVGLPRKDAESTVNEILPGRVYSKSLYSHLVLEHVLICNMDETVYINYERLADYLVADALLDKYPTADIPESVIEKASPGLIEALCVQVPERSGKEMPRIAPHIFDYYMPSETYLPSIVWRKKSAFSEDTKGLLAEIFRADGDLGDLWEAMLTVATIPGHMFNADSLDGLLRRYAMPERDAIWSVCLHRMWRWEGKGPVHRLVDWAWSIQPAQQIESAVVDLAATALGWMLTTSNRFLRDRATKGLVALLTGRFTSTLKLIDKFADVDDPYVRERIYAIAYGVAMRSYEVDQIGELATSVYGKIFAHGNPPAHILLRDYARGVIERAVHLGASIDLDLEKIRPPYQSEWPTIPGEREIEELLPVVGKQVEFSTGLAGDFSRYVVPCAEQWLPLRRTEKPWQSPEERKRRAIRRFSKDEKLAWEQYKRSPRTKRGWIDMALDGEIDLDQIKRKNETRIKKLLAKLTKRNKRIMKSVLQTEREGKPRFDLQTIVRYIRWRVSDLGWTGDRFDQFDQMVSYSNKRQAGKAERIGKKYQWIAFHEILAYLADHYQYRDYNEAEYYGPWQQHLRDIDPSCMLSSAHSQRYQRSWWASLPYQNWREEVSHEEWTADETDLPRIGDITLIVQDSDGIRWVNMNGSFTWEQPSSPGVERYSVPRRNLWMHCEGYFVRSEDVDTFMDWAQSVNFWGRWMPESHILHDVFLGEHGWAEAFNHLKGEPEWRRPERHNCPVEVLPYAVEYGAGDSGFDCSIDQGYTLQIPHPEFVRKLGLKWSDEAADYVDSEGNRAAFDPTAHEGGPRALLVREDLLERYLSEEGLTLIWAVIGEKIVLGGKDNKWHGMLTISGACRYAPDGQRGFWVSHHNPPRD